MALQGNDISNETIVNIISSSLIERYNLLYAAIVKKALEYEFAIKSTETCIDVWPGEDPAHPVAMFPYNSPADFRNVAPYGKSFNAPYRFVQFSR